MRRIALLAAAVAMLLFALAPAAQARVVFNEDVPFESGGGSLCGGEEISFGGTAHVLLTSTEDQAGGSHWVMHSNFQKTTAVGLDSGTRFVLRQVDHSAVNVRSLDPGETTTYIINGRLIRLGEDGTHSDDTLVHITGHITQAATGEVTTVFEQVVFHCD
jgi:hypothetical protein